MKIKIRGKRKRVVDPVKYVFTLISMSLASDVVEADSFRRYFGTKKPININPKWGRWTTMAVIRNILRRRELVLWQHKGKLYLTEPGRVPE